MTDENKNVELTELDLQALEAVSGGNDPVGGHGEISEAEVEERLKGWVWYFKNLGLSRESAEEFIDGAIHHKLHVYWFLAKDPNRYRDRFMQLWDTFGTW